MIALILRSLITRLKILDFRVLETRLNFRSGCPNIPSKLGRAADFHAPCLCVRVMADVASTKGLLN